MRKYFYILTLISLLFNSAIADDEQREWINNAVWYKILPERFRNINPANDPVKENVVCDVAFDWQVHPWASNWYKPQIWEKERGVAFSDVIMDRRYGGDLIGVIEKLPYLQSLGVDVIYLTPIFESPSVEKYDAVTFHHIDNNFGTDRKEDQKKILNEDENPGNWTFTKSDEIFLELLNQAHEIDMKVVVEAVFSYCSEDFFAFRNLREEQQKSPYKDWFDVQSWDDPETPDTVEFSYKAWQGDPQKPLFKISTDGLLAEPVKKYIFDITTRWMNPDSNNVTPDGVDGWFVKDASGLSHRFWQEWNKHVHELNKNSATIARKKDLSDASDFDILRDNGLSNQILHFFAKPEKDRLVEFNEALKKIWDETADEKRNSTLIQLSDINSLRFPSAIVNADFLSKTNGTSHWYSDNFSPLKPDSVQAKIQRLMLVFQLTYPGSPLLLYGDESGMWGAGYPDVLKPMLWNEFLYEDESYNEVRPELEKKELNNKVEHDIFNIYRKLNDLRKETEVLVKGEYVPNLLDEENGVFIYSRKHSDEVLLVVMNLSDKKQEIVYNPGFKKNQKVQDIIRSNKFKIDKFDLKLELEPKGFRVLMKD